MTMNVSEVLTKAADLMQRNGKATGGFVECRDFGVDLSTLPMCALGAIGYVICGDPIHGRTGSLAHQTIAKLRQYIPDGRDIARWSDGNTAATVIAVLRLAAEPCDEPMNRHNPRSGH